MWMQNMVLDIISYCLILFILPSLEIVIYYPQCTINFGAKFLVKILLTN